MSQTILKTPDMFHWYRQTACEHNGLKVMAGSRQRCFPTRRARLAQSTCCSASGAHKYISSSDSSRHFLHFMLHYDASQHLPFRVISEKSADQSDTKQVSRQLYGISELHIILHANGTLCWILRQWAHHFALKIINKSVKVVLAYFSFF